MRSQPLFTIKVLEELYTTHLLSIGRSELLSCN